MASTGLFRIALLQMVSHGLDQAANLEKGEAFCRKAAHAGADLALFPELWNVGYTLGDPAVWAGAITRDHPFYAHFQSVARELEMAVALTFLERGPDGLRNTLSLIDRTGGEVLAYSKVHTCAFDKEAPLVRGCNFPVATLTTARGDVQVGAMICYDREFPESARILMLNGAEIVLTPNACELEVNRLEQYRARAYENVLGLAMANYAAPRTTAIPWPTTAWPSTRRSVRGTWPWWKRVKTRGSTWPTSTWRPCAPTRPWNPRGPCAT